MSALELVDDAVRVGPYLVRLRRPKDAEALIDEARFGEDEFMPYWAELWPTGVALAEEVAELELKGARVVELGCGLALPSIVAALGGAQALAVDWAPAALSLARENAARNGVVIETLDVDWAQPEPLLERSPFDLVLCADVLYEPRNIEALVRLLPKLAAEVLLGEPGRQTAAAFFEAADRDWRVTRTARVNRLERLRA